MTITIPEWVLWMAGSLIGLVILILAAVGGFLLWAMPARFWR